MALLTAQDLVGALPDATPEELQILIEDAEALAAVYAPCITSPSFKNKAAAKAIIRKAIVYDVQAQEEGNNISREATGPYSKEYRTPTRSGTFYSKSQIEALQRLCVLAVPGVYSLQLGSP